MLHRQAHPGHDWNNRHLRRRPIPALAKQAVVQAPVRPGYDWTLVLRRQPARIVDGQPQGGYTDVFELICCDCGDDPDLDYRHVPSGLQQIRGPYPIVAAIAAYERHVRHHRRFRRAPAGHAGSGRGGT